MYHLDLTGAREIMKAEYGYSAADLHWLLDSFPPLNSRLGPAVDQWLADRRVIHLEVQGLILAETMARRASSFLAMIRQFNSLLDESLPQDDRDRLREALSHPAIFE